MAVDALYAYHGVDRHAKVRQYHRDRITADKHIIERVETISAALFNVGVADGLIGGSMGVAIITGAGEIGRLKSCVPVARKLTTTESCVALQSTSNRVHEGGARQQGR